MKQQPVIAVIGLGYVGLPLATAFSDKYRVIGYDVNKERIVQLNNGIDATQEVSAAVLMGAKNLTLTHNSNDIAEATIFIVTVPTPLTPNNLPDLSFLTAASELVGKHIQPGGIVVYESTVYPGCTEEVCVPVVEQHSGLVFNKDFFVGYSPERINPGDATRSLSSIVKVVAGSTPAATQMVATIYRSIIEAGVYEVSSIKVAEAAKAIENAQRDVNISFMNELALLFDKLDIDTQEVLAAAGTKWNFLPFKPGLVGGHCIGVDPYYLAQRAQEFGYHPEIILAGRRLNDSMGEYVASQVVKLMIKKGIAVNGASLLMLGITFKENCPDVRNTKIVDVIAALKDYGVKVTIYDPWANPAEVKHEYKLETSTALPKQKFDTVVLGVSHRDFNYLNFDDLLAQKSILYDVKGTLSRYVDGCL